MEHYAKLRRHWDDEAVPVHGDTSDATMASYAEELIDACRPTGRERALDVGCGDGQIGVHMRAQVASLDGFDFAAHRVANARARIPDGTFWAQSFLDEIESGPYDLVYSWGVMQYCRPEHVDLFLERCVDAMATGGRIVHGDVVDRSLLAAYYAVDRTLKKTIGQLRAALRPGRPLWRDGTFALDLDEIAARWTARGFALELLPARAGYRRHVVLRRA